MLTDRFGKIADGLCKKKLFLFDMDGTVYLENRLFDGVAKLLSSIERTGGRYVFLTNNSSKSVEDYVEKVRSMGIPVTREHFYTSTQAACATLLPLFGNNKIYAQGTASFLAELKRGGLNVTGEYDKEVCAVLVGYDTELTYQKLLNTCRLLTKSGLPYYATNPDWVCPTSFGYAPDCGSMCFGIEKATGRVPVYIGKPKADMVRTVMLKYGKTPKETLVLGDRIYTDIAAGLAAGVDTVCVLSGECTLEDIAKSGQKPHYVFESVAALNALFEEKN